MPSDTLIFGDNQGPPFVVDESAISPFEERVRDFADAAADWEKAGEVTSEEMATKINDFISGARKLAKEVDTARKDAKEPYLTAGKEIDERFKLLLRPLEIAMEKAKTLLTPYQRRKAEEAERLKAEKEAEAKRLVDEAKEKAAGAAQRGDAMAIAEAEMMAKRAEEAEREAAGIKTTGAVGSASGGRTTALRTYYSARIDKAHIAMAWVLRHHEVAMLEFLTAICNRSKRENAGVSIPGVTFMEEKR